MRSGAPAAHEDKASVLSLVVRIGIKSIKISPSNLHHQLLNPSNHNNIHITLIQTTIHFTTSIPHSQTKPTLKMKTTSILITFLTTLAAASPTLRRQAPPTPSVTFSLSNDITGTNVPLAVLADGTPIRLGTAFAGTALDKAGIVTATSGQLVTLDATVFCVVDNGAGQVWRLNSQNTFVDLDGVEGAVETNVNDFVLTCEF